MPIPTTINIRALSESGRALHEHQREIALQFLGEQFAGLAKFASLDEIMNLSEVLTLWEELSASDGDCPLHGAIAALFPHSVPQ